MPQKPNQGSTNLVSTTLKTKKMDKSSWVHQNDCYKDDNKMIHISGNMTHPSKEKIVRVSSM